MPTGHVGKVPGSSRIVGSAIPLDVSVVDGSGNQVTSFGGTGGTASTFGAAFPASGTAAGFKDSTGALMAPGNLDASGFLKVNIAAGSGANAAAGATGAAVPASADYQGINVGGTLRGQTGVNPAGVVYAAQTDLASIAGTTVATLDFDTGAGTQAMPILGIALPASGGAVAGGTSTNPVRTDPTGTTTQPVSGTITANAGTNLNTSLLALESGGNLATAVASLSVMDDWDETDRAKVNLIVGQAGIAAGTGVDGVTVPRVTLATNVALPAGTNVIGHVITDSNSVVAASGDVAHDGVDAGNPIKVGTKAITTLPTAVAANDRANLIGDVTGRAFVRNGREGPATAFWSQIHVPAANTQATKSQSAGAAGVRNVCTGFTVTIAGGATAPAAINLTVNLIDGASGGGTYLWRSTISLPAVAGALVSIVRGSLWIPGTAATAMTMEFSAAGGANTVESVSFEGTTVTE